MHNIVAAPGFGLLATIFIGAVAGWIAEKITASNHGLLTNIVVGVIGSAVGVLILNALKIRAVGGFLYTILVAAFGAVVVLWLWRAVRGR